MNKLDSQFFLVTIQAADNIWETDQSNDIGIDMKSCDRKKTQNFRSFNLFALDDVSRYSDYFVIQRLPLNLQFYNSATFRRMAIGGIPSTRGWSSAKRE